MQTNAGTAVVVVDPVTVLVDTVDDLTVDVISTDSVVVPASSVTGNVVGSIDVVVGDVVEIVVDDVVVANGCYNNKNLLCLIAVGCACALYKRIPW